jgi:hypothetical protein
MRGSSFAMKPHIPVVLTVLFCLAGCASQGKASQRVLRDPVASWFEGASSREDADATTVSVVEADFNCDGRKDMAITDSRMGGTGGSIWTLYLRRPDGRYAEAGDVTTKSNRFHISRLKKGAGRLAVMTRGGPGNLLITFYDVSAEALREIRNEPVHLTEEQSGRTRIEEVFGDDYSELPARQFTVAELKEKLRK